MAETEWETKLEKQIRILQSQINSLQTQMQRLLRTITHPSAMTYIKSQLGSNSTPEFKSLKLTTVSIYANNAAAIAGGLVAGDFYRLGADPDHLCIVH